MTQIPPKASSNNDSNGRGSNSKIIQIENQTPVTNDFSNRGLFSYEEQEGIELTKPKDKEQIVPAQKNALQRHPSRFWRLSSLRTKAIAVALALGTVPVVLVGTISYFARSQGLKQQIIQNEQVNANDLQDKLNLFVQDAYTNTIMMSSLNFLTVAKVRDI